MHATFIAADGSTQDFDLDDVIDIVGGYSKSRLGWTSLVVLEPGRRVFIELRSSPPTVRGEQQDEAEEVSTQYVSEWYGIDVHSLSEVYKNPDAWTFRRST